MDNKKKTQWNEFPATRFQGTIIKVYARNNRLALAAITNKDLNEINPGMSIDVVCNNQRIRAWRWAPEARESLAAEAVSVYPNITIDHSQELFSWRMAT